MSSPPRTRADQPAILADSTRTGSSVAAAPFRVRHLPLAPEMVLHTVDELRAGALVYS